MIKGCQPLPPAHPSGAVCLKYLTRFCARSRERDAGEPLQPSSVLLICIDLRAHFHSGRVMMSHKIA